MTEQFINMPRSANGKTAYPLVTLSDGEPAEVRPLPLWSFDDLREKHLEGYEGPYEFEVATAGGGVTTDFIDITQLDTPPEKPTTPEDDGLEWSEYRHYHRAIIYEQTKAERYARFKRDCRKRIISQQSPAVRKRIISRDDFAAVANAAMTPEVSLEDVADAARRSFPL